MSKYHENPSKVLNYAQVSLMGFSRHYIELANSIFDLWLEFCNGHESLTNKKFKVLCWSSIHYQTILSCIWYGIRCQSIYMHQDLCNLSGQCSITEASGSLDASFHLDVSGNTKIPLTCLTWTNIHPNGHSSNICRQIILEPDRLYSAITWIL